MTQNSAYNQLQLLYLNPKFITANVVNSGSTGDIDFYTCPTGRSAILIGYMYINSNAVSATYQLKAKVSATYYKVANTHATVGQNTPGSSTANVTMIGAGDGLAMNADLTGLNLWANIIEFDATGPIKLARLTSFINGDNTLYTCPAGKSAVLLANNLSPFNINNPTTFIHVAQVSGGTLSYYINLVPSGGSPGATNKFLAATNGTSGNRTSLFLPVALSAGDYINLNSNSTNATQIAFAIIWEQTLPV